MVIFIIGFIGQCFHSMIQSLELRLVFRWGLDLDLVLSLSFSPLSKENVYIRL